MLPSTDSWGQSTWNSHTHHTSVRVPNEWLAHHRPSPVHHGVSPLGSTPTSPPLIGIPAVRRPYSSRFDPPVSPVQNTAEMNATAHVSVVPSVLDRIINSDVPSSNMQSNQASYTFGALDAPEVMVAPGARRLGSVEEYSTPPYIPSSQEPERTTAPATFTNFFDAAQFDTEHTQHHNSQPPQGAPAWGAPPATRISQNVPMSGDQWRFGMQASNFAVDAMKQAEEAERKISPRDIHQYESRLRFETFEEAHRSSHG